jgi:hypothetical protein
MMDILVYNNSLSLVTREYSYLPEYEWPSVTFRETAFGYAGE